MSVAASFSIPYQLTPCQITRWPAASTIWFPFVDSGNFGFVTACATGGVKEATTVLTIAIATNLLRIGDHLSTCSNEYWLFEEFPAQGCDCKCNHDDNRT